MESKIKSLIVVGASVAADCQPCLRSAIDGAHENGVEEKEIAEAIEIAAKFVQSLCSLSCLS